MVIHFATLRRTGTRPAALQISWESFTCSLAVTNAATFSLTFANLNEEDEEEEDRSDILRERALQSLLYRHYVYIVV